MWRQCKKVWGLLKKHEVFCKDPDNRKTPHKVFMVKSRTIMVQLVSDHFGKVDTNMYEPWNHLRLVFAEADFNLKPDYVKLLWVIKGQGKWRDKITTVWYGSGGGENSLFSWTPFWHALSLASLSESPPASWNRASWKQSTNSDTLTTHTSFRRSCESDVQSHVVLTIFAICVRLDSHGQTWTDMDRQIMLP